MEQVQDFNTENLFILVNGFSKNNVAGILQEFRYLPVVVLKYSEDPEFISDGFYSLKKCDILMLGEVITYEKCKVRMIVYND